MQCRNHKERKSRLICQKEGAGLCEECLVCNNGGSYCMFRPSCQIWYITEEARKEAEQTGSAIQGLADS